MNTGKLDRKKVEALSSRARRAILQTVVTVQRDTVSRAPREQGEPSQQAVVLPCAQAVCQALVWTQTTLQPRPRSSCWVATDPCLLVGYYKMDQSARATASQCQ